MKKMRMLTFLRMGSDKRPFSPEPDNEVLRGDFGNRLTDGALADIIISSELGFARQGFRGGEFTTFDSVDDHIPDLGK